MLAMRGIVKSYGAVRANRGIDLDVPAGAIVGLLGENGSGKTTLMNVLYGLVRPDAGSATFRGRPLPLGSPRAALAAGLGMVHQHFMLVPPVSVNENAMLRRRAARSWRPAPAGRTSRGSWSDATCRLPSSARPARPAPRSSWSPTSTPATPPASSGCAA